MRLTRSLRPASLLAALIVSGASGRALAQESAAIAEQLFRDGRALMDQGKTDEACEKFAASQRVAPAVGTQLNLAICREKQGRTATAWSLFSDVEAQALRNGDRARAGIAHEHQTALTPQLKKMVIEVPSPPAGMVVKLDGLPLPAGALGTEIPLDPGDHELIVTAPGKKTWDQAKLNLRPSAMTVHVRVELENEAGTPAAAPPAPIDAPPSPPPPVAAAPADSAAGADQGPSAKHVKRTVGFVVGGVGIVGLGVGTAFGALMASKSSQRDSLCPPGNPCSQQAAFNDDHDARVDQQAMFIAGGIGLVALGVGAVLVLTSLDGPADAAAGIHLAPLVGCGTGGAQIGGSW